MKYEASDIDYHQILCTGSTCRNTIVPTLKKMVLTKSAQVAKNAKNSKKRCILAAKRYRREFMCSEGGIDLTETGYQKEVSKHASSVGRKAVQYSIMRIFIEVNEKWVANTNVELCELFVKGQFLNACPEDLTLNLRTNPTTDA